MSILDQLAQSKAPAASSIHVPAVFEMFAGLSDLPDLEWLIEDFLPAPGIAVLGGPPGNGKSFVAIDFALTLAGGVAKWRDHRVSPVPSVYIAGEGVHGMKKRIEAWKVVHPEVNFLNRAHLIAERIQLNQPDPLAGLILALDRLPARPGFIVIDTLHQHSKGMEENSAKEMGIWLDGAQRLKERYGATVLIVHHTSKSGGLRGSISLEGAADTIFLMKKDAPSKGLFELSVAKQKEGAEGEPLVFALQPVLNSAVIVSADPPQKAGSDLDKRVNELLDDPEENMLDAARKLALEFPDIFKGKDPTEAARARLKRVKAKREKVDGRTGAASTSTVH